MIRFIDGEAVEMNDEEIAEFEAQTAAIAPSLDNLKAKRAGQVEASVVEIYRKPTTLAREYEFREADAIAFRGAEYTGTPGKYLKDFADSAAMDYESAAERVLVQAVAFRAAEPTLAAQRMRKYEIQRATSAEQIEQIFAEINAALQEVIQQLA